MELYAERVEAVRFFLHENPAGAASWGQDVVSRILGVDGVEQVVVVQCQYGASDTKGNPVKKPTATISNPSGILRELTKRCNGRGGQCSRMCGGTHTLCSGLVARRAAGFPFELCRAILVGFKKWLVALGVVQYHCVGMHFV